MEEFEQVLPTGEVEAPAAPRGWHDSLSPELRESRAKALAKFSNDDAGLNKFFESYGNLETLLGKKGALGPPDSPDGYKLPDTVLSDGTRLDKAKFAEIIHKAKLSEEQASALWGEYSGMLSQHVQSQAVAQQNSEEDYQTQINNVVGELRSEWGEKYDEKVAAGQAVLNNFCQSQEENDFLTASLCQDARGVRFLARLGEQFSENKIGDFSASGSSGTGDAQAELDRLTADMAGPYWNAGGKHSAAEHAAAVERVNALQSRLARRG